VTTRAARAALLVVAMSAGAGVRASAQGTATTTLTVGSGSTATFANPTLADYVNGYIDGPTVTFTVTTVSGGTQPRTTTVEVCATSATLGSGKALSKLLWQPTDNSKPYQSILTGCTGTVNPSRVVGTNVISRGGSWTGGVRLRMLLDWTDTAPSYGTTIEMALSVSP
jgi:hypothetical protein